MAQQSELSPDLSLCILAGQEANIVGDLDTKDDRLLFQEEISPAYPPPQSKGAPAPLWDQCQCKWHTEAPAQDGTLSKSFS